VADRFGDRQTEHVAGNDPIALRQWLPRNANPNWRSEAVDEQQRLTLPGRPITNGLARNTNVWPLRQTHSGISASAIRFITRVLLIEFT
jgi:hypothetical protein